MAQESYLPGDDSTSAPFGGSRQATPGESAAPALTEADLYVLAEKVYALLKEELLIDRERLGYKH